MTKFMLLALAIAIMVSAGSVCASNREDVESAITAYLDASLNDRYEEAYSYLSDKDRDAMSLEEYESEKESRIVITCNEFTKRTTFKVKGIDIEGDRAAVEVEITEPDVRVIMQDLVGAFVAWILDDEEDFKKMEEEMEAKYSKGDIPMKTEVELYNMVKEAGSWRVDLDRE
jgi:hypothetical protein